MKSTYTTFSMRKTSQKEAIPGREREQLKNDAGGFVFHAGMWKLFERFLLMGTEGGTFYVQEKALTKENAINTLACINADGRRAVRLIEDVSQNGLAPKNDACLFALALASSAPSPDTRALALLALPKVARIPTHLFHFATYVKQFRGMGRGLKNAFARWYNDKTVQDLAYATVKYQQRDGWANRDLLRLAHPKTKDAERNALYKWITDGMGSFEEAPDRAEILPRVVTGFEIAKTTPVRYLPRVIRDYNLAREMVSTESLNDPDVWEVLLEKMPATALIRNLGNMSKTGLLKPLSDASNSVVMKITDKQWLRKSKVHPVALLIALKQYGLGHGLRGEGRWTPVPTVLDALDQAFYAAFDELEPTGKRMLIGVDMSGSMMGSAFKGWKDDYTKDIAGTALHPCEAAAALALAVAKKEQQFFICGFSDKFKELGITPRMRLDEAMRLCLAATFGRTDCAVPIIWATENKISVDAFVTIGDNETFAGPVHPTQALKKYREATGIHAKAAVIMTVPKPFSIADPADPEQIDISGFSADVPGVINAFIKGGIGE